MSLGKGLAFSNSNKDKFAGITVVVQERREQREEKRRDSWRRSSEEFKGDYFGAKEEFGGKEKIVDIQFNIVETKKNPI